MPHSNTNPWHVIAFASLMQAVSVGIAVYTFAYFVLPWMNTFQVSRTSMLLATTLQSAAVVVLSPIVGALIDKYDSKKMMLAASLVFCLALLGISIASNHRVIILLFGCALPIGITFCGPLMGYSMVARTHINRKGLAMGISALGTSLGGFVFAPLVTQLLTYLNNDWRVVFQILAAISFCLIFLLGLVIVKSNDPIAKAPSQTTAKRSSVQLALSPNVLKLSLCYMLPAMLFMSILHNMAGMAADLNIQATKAAIITAIAAILMAAGKVCMGALSDRLNQRTLYVCIIFALIIGAIITALASSYTALFFGVCTVAFPMGGVAPLTANIVARHWPQASFGRIMGVVHAFGGAAGFGALIAGYSRDITGSYTVVFLGMTGFLLVAAFIFLSLPKSDLATL